VPSDPLEATCDGGDSPVERRNWLTATVGFADPSS